MQQKHNIKMFLTRIGENSKLVVNGDPSQVDLINQSQSGLIKSKNILKNLKEIKIIEFDHTDVVRHPLVSKNYPRLSKKAQMIKVNVVSNNNLGKDILKDLLTILIEILKN